MHRSRGASAQLRAVRCRASPQPWQRLAMTVTVATLGFPRIGPRRELKTALERLLGRQAAPGVAGDRRRPARQGLGAQRDPAWTSSHPTISRSTIMCWTRSRWWAPCRRSTAGAATGRAGNLFRHGARSQPGSARRRRMRLRHGHRGRRAGGGDDQVVRHQLPLPRPGVRRGPGVRLASTKAVDEYPRGKGARDRDPPGAAGAGHLSPARQDARTASSIR